MLIHYRKPGVNKEEFLNHTLAVTRKELKSTDANLKLQAAYKLLFLYNEGIDIQWAAFNVIEMMASQKFQTKRISYALAVLIFNDVSSQASGYMGSRGSDGLDGSPGKYSLGGSSSDELGQLLTLTPNIFRKDFSQM